MMGYESLLVFLFMRQKHSHLDDQRSISEVRNANIDELYGMLSPVHIRGQFLYAGPRSIEAYFSRLERQLGVEYQDLHL